MNKIIKNVVLKILLLFFISFIITSCSNIGNDNQPPVDGIDIELVNIENARDNLEIIFKDSNNNYLYVTNDVELVTFDEENSVLISWNSSNHNVINLNGNVTRPGLDTEVILTAVITNNKYSLKKEFNLNVIGTFSLDVLEASLHLEVGFTNNNNTYDYVTNDLILNLIGINDTNIVWYSRNPEVITHDGKVLRQDHDVIVILEARITKGTINKTNTYTLLVKGTLLEELQNAKNDLELIFTNINDSVERVTNNLILTKVEVNGINISWESNNLNVVSNNGEVNRSDIDHNVILTATISKNGAYLTKTFEIIVIKIDETNDDIIDEDGLFNQRDEVALYLVTYSKLPKNYMLKNEVVGHIRNYWTPTNKASVGGDRFYNNEGLLPNLSGRLYYEADINYQGEQRRNSLRIVYSNDGLIFYTSDHYGSFVKYDEVTKTWKSF